MEVKDYMSTNVITVMPETTVMKALDLMKEHDIHRLPVVEDGKLVGLLTEELVAGHSPSMATSLSMHELNYLLNKTTASEIMQKQVLTVKAHTLLEEAASLMRQQNVGVLPVVDARGHVEGIITDKDIFDAFIEISGYNTPGSRLFIEINEDKPGPLEEISNVLRENNVNVSTISVYHRDGKVQVVLHVDSTEPDEVADFIAQKGYRVISAMRKEVKGLKRCFKILGHLHSYRNNCTGLSLGLSPCESQRAPKRFSLWSSNSFRMHVVISMTIESKDFFATPPCFFIGNHDFYEKTCIGLSLHLSSYLCSVHTIEPKDLIKIM